MKHISEFALGCAMYCVLMGAALFLPGIAFAVWREIWKEWRKDHQKKGQWK